MQVHAWMEFPLLIFGIWFLMCCILLVTNQRILEKMCRKTCCMPHHQENTPRTKLRLQFSTTILNFATSITFLQTWSLLSLVRYSVCIFLVHEAVKKMIIKGRSPTMRHVSRTHRVAFDCLLDRINLEPKIQIKFVDTKHHLADILTKSSFTTDDWTNLLHLFKIAFF